MQKEGIIYGYKFPTGKWYVGQSWRIKNRDKEHKSESREDTLFYRAVRKYGKPEVQTLFSGIKDQDDLDWAEQFFIWDCNAMRPNGYNTKEGGRGGRHNSITKKQMSKSHTGVKLSDFHREQIRKGKSGKNHHFYGKKLTQEHKDKIARSTSGDKNHNFGKKFGPLPQDVKDKISKKLSGKGNPFYGKKHTEETKRKISEARRKSKTANTSRGQVEVKETE